MKNYILVVAVALPLALGLSGCGDDQPGYADDGSGNCSDALVADYDNIIEDMGSLGGQIQSQSTLADDLELSEVQAEQTQASTVASEISAFQSTYGDVSCTAQKATDESMIVIDEDQMNQLSEKVSTIQEELAAEAAQISAGEVQPTSPTVASPLCEGSSMYNDNLEISEALTKAENLVKAAEDNVDPEQKRQDLITAQASLVTISAQLLTFNQKYPDEYCQPETGPVLASMSLSDTESAEVTQLNQQIEKDLAALPTENRVEH
jgi:hypothetical protein